MSLRSKFSEIEQRWLLDVPRLRAIRTGMIAFGLGCLYFAVNTFASDFTTHKFTIGGMFISVGTCIVGSYFLVGGLSGDVEWLNRRRELEDVTERRKIERLAAALSLDGHV